MGGQPGDGKGGARVKKKLELELTDLHCPLMSAGLMTVLRTAELGRARRVERSPLAKKVQGFGYRSPLDLGSWRDVARRFLRRHLHAHLHVGGHHVAVHAAGPITRDGQLPPCLARIVEVSPV